MAAGAPSGACAPNPCVYSTHPQGQGQVSGPSQRRTIKTPRDGAGRCPRSLGGCAFQRRTAASAVCRFLKHARQRKKAFALNAICQTWKQSILSSPVVCGYIPLYHLRAGRLMRKGLWLISSDFRFLGRFAGPVLTSRFLFAIRTQSLQPWRRPAQVCDSRRLPTNPGMPGGPLQ